MPTVAADEHHCSWREEALALRQLVQQQQQMLQAQEQLIQRQQQVIEEQKRLIEELQRNQELSAQKIAALQTQLAKLERRLHGPKSEKLKPVEEELKPERDKEADRLRALERRRERQALRERLQAETILHHVEADKQCCPHCGNERLSPLGDGKRTTVYEYVPGSFVRQEHVQEKLA